MANTNAVPARPDAPLAVKRLGLALLAAVVVNLIVYGIGSAAGATWSANGQPVTSYLVVIATVVPTVIGGAVTFLLARRWARATSVMAWVGLAFAVLTMPSPLLASDNAPTGWSLATMHLVTGAAWFVAVRPRTSGSKA